MFEDDPYLSRFWENVPREYAQEVVQGLALIYPQAYERAYGEFAGPEAQNYLPSRRRALTEGMLRKTAEKYPQLKATAERDTHSGWWNHTRITCGQGLILTANKVPDPEHVVRHSFFREQYARDNGQLWLFNGEDKPERQNSNQVYGIILHGSAFKDPSKLGFVVVRFPKPDLTGYYLTRIDLLREFAEVEPKPSSFIVNEAPPENIDEEPDIGFQEGEDVG